MFTRGRSDGDGSLAFEQLAVMVMALMRTPFAALFTQNPSGFTPILSCSPQRVGKFTKPDCALLSIRQDNRRHDGSKRMNAADAVAHRRRETPRRLEPDSRWAHHR